MLYIHANLIRKQNFSVHIERITPDKEEKKQFIWEHVMEFLSNQPKHISLLSHLSSRIRFYFFPFFCCAQMDSRQIIFVSNYRFCKQQRWEERKKNGQIYNSIEAANMYWNIIGYKTVNILNKIDFLFVDVNVGRKKGLLLSTFVPNYDRRKSKIKQKQNENWKAFEQLRR